MSASPTQPKEAAAKAAEQLKVDVGKSLATLERLLKIDDPTFAVQLIQRWIETSVKHIKEGSTEGIFVEILTQVAPKAVGLLLRRSNLEDNEPLVVNGFLDFYLTTIIQLFPLTNPQYIDIATKILFHNHAFWESYGRRNEDSGFSSDEEQDALMGDDTKEDSDGDIDDEDRAMVGGKKPKRYIHYKYAVSGWLLGQINRFVKRGGFQAMIERLRECKERPYGLGFLRICVRLVARVREFLVESYLQSLSNELIAVVFARIQCLTDDDIKHEEKTTLHDILADFEKIVMSAHPDQVAGVAERVRLEVAFRMTKCSVLEKRLLGLTDLKDLAQLTLKQREEALARREVLRRRKQNREDDNDDDIYGIHRGAGRRYGSDVEDGDELDEVEESLKHIHESAAWYAEKQVVEYLFGPGLHAELLKRCDDILWLLGAENLITKTHLDLMWDSQTDKHESDVHLIWRAIGLVGKHLPVELNDYIFAKVNAALPLSDYTPSYLQMVRDVSIHGINHCLRLPSQEKKWYGVDTFWLLLQEEVRCSAEVKASADSNLTNFLAWLPCFERRFHYLRLCLDKIRAGRSLVHALRSFGQILNTYNSNASHNAAMEQMRSGTGEGVDVPCLDEASAIAYLGSTLKTDNTASANNDSQGAGAASQSAGVVVIIDILIDSLRLFKKQQAELKVQVGDDSRASSYTHIISEYLQLLEQLMRRTRTQLTQSQLESVWSLCMEQARFPSERDQVAEWLIQVFLSFGATSSSPSSVGDGSRSSADIVALFPTKLGHLDFQANYDSLMGTPTTWKLFEALFRRANVVAGSILDTSTPATATSASTSSLSVLQHEPNIIGLDTLWNAVLRIRNPEVGKSAANLLVQLYTLLAPSLSSSLATIRHDFLRRCMGYLKSNASQHDETSLTGLSRALGLIHSILSGTSARASGSNTVGSNGGDAVVGHGKAGRGATLNLNVVILKPSTKFAVAVFANDTVEKLKQTIGERMNEPAHVFRLISSGKELGPDTNTLVEAKLGDGATVHVIKRVPVAGADSGTAAASATSSTATTAASAPVAAVTKSLVGDASVDPISVAGILSSHYFSDLFELLSLTGNLSVAVWNLLMQLPTNQQILDSLKSLSSDNAWKALLDPDNTYKLFYSLQIVDGLLNEPNATATTADESQWRSRFVGSGGIGLLFHILLTSNWGEKETAAPSPTLAPADGASSSSSSPSSSTIHETRSLCLSLLLRLLDQLCCISLPSFSALPPASAGIKVLSEATMTLLATDGSDSGDATLPAVVDRLLVLSRFTASRTLFAGSDQQPQPHANVKPDEQVIGAALPLIVSILASGEAPLSTVFDHPQFSQWLHDCLLTSPSTRTRTLVGQNLQRVCSALTLISRDSSPNVKAHKRLLSYLTSFLSSLPSKAPWASQYFTLFAGIIRDCCVVGTDAGGVAEGELEPLMKLVRDTLVNHPIVEHRGEADAVPVPAPGAVDSVFIGLCDVISAIILRDPTLKESAGKGLVQFLVSTCLFSVPSPECSGPDSPPLCKSKASRLQAFKLLLELGDKCPSNYSATAETLLSLHGQRRKAIRGWNYAPAGADKGSSPFVGLKNLGATCYMNSLMQQFHMIPQFRQKLLKVPSVYKEDAQDRSENMLWELQSIFASLQESEKKFYDPSSFCKSYKYEGQPMNPGVQMDVDEFFLHLLDKLETLTKGTEQEQLLKTFFGGNVAHQIVSKECEHISDRDEPFYTVQVEVKNRRNLYESLAAYIQGDLLDGDNKYKCEKCNKGVDAVKRVCIGSLPNNLVISLKRFEFDMETMRRFKVTDNFEFPMNLNVKPYTREGLAANNATATADAAANTASAADNADNADAATAKDANAANEDPNYAYELTGVIVHMGTADSGHYYSFIKDRTTNQWYCFNDTSVEPFDPRKLPDECFGGYETTTVLDGQQKRVARRQNKYNSAYMLIYSKVIPTQPQVSTPVDRAQLAQAVPSRLYQTLWDDNLDFLRDRQLFDPDYFQFATQLLQLQANAEKEQEQQAYADAMRMGAEYGIKLLVETLVHAKEKEKFSDALGHLHALLSASPAACQWFLSTMLQDNLGWVKKMLWDCPVSDVRAAFAGLLVHALKTLAPLERQSYLVNVVLGADDPRLPALQDAQKFDMETEERMGEEYSQYTKAVARGSMSVGVSGGAGAGAADATDVFFPPAARHLSEVFKLPVDHNTGLYMYPLSLVARFMDRYFSLLRLAHTAGAWRYFSEYFYVMEQFSLLGASERAYLNSRHVAATLVDYYMGVESPHSTGKRSKRDPNKAELQAVANMKHLIGTVSVLVRSSAFPRDQPSSVAVVSTSPAAITDPSASKDDSLLPEPDAQWVQHKLFLSRAMSESNFVESMSSLAQHLVWDNASVSERIVELINNTVNRVDYGLFEPLFAVMSAVLELQEGDGSELHARRVTKAVTGLARVIEENLKYMKATQYAVRYLAELANNHAEARDFLFQSMKTWLPELSTYDKNERVRLATESIVLSFVKDLPGGNYDPFPQASQSQSVDPSNSAGANEVALMNLGARPQQYLALSVEQPLSPDSHAKLVAINKFLWEHVETIAHTRATGEPSMTAKTGDSFPPSFFRLRSLFRLIQWTLRTPELVENVQLHYPFLLKLVVAMDKNQYECDLNKLEIIRLLDLSTQLPSNLTALSNLLLPSSAVRGAGAGAGAVGDDDMDVVQRHHEEQAEASERLTHFYAYFISLRNTYKYIQYNEAGCVPFYRVINRLALHQPTLAVLCTEHRNWDWAIRWLCLDTLSYPESATELLGIAAKSARESQPFRLKGLSYAAKLMKEKGHTSSSFQPDNFVRYCRILLSSSSSTASVDGGDASTSMGTAVNVSQLPLAESLAFTDGGGHRTLLALFEYIDISSYIDGTDYVSPTTTEILDVVALALSWVEIAHHVPHNFGSGNSNAVLEQLDPVAAAPLLSLSTADPLVLHRIDKHRTNMVAWLNNGRTLDVLMDFIRRLDILSLRDARVAGLLLRIANVLRILMKLDSELVPPLVLPLVDEWLQFHEVSATSTSTSTSSSAPSEVEGSSGESSSILSFPAYALSEFIPNVISSSLAAKVSSASDPAEMNQRYTLAAAILLRSLQWAIQANNAVAVQALGRTLALHKDSGLAPLVGSQDKFLDVISSLAVIDSSSSSLLVALDGCHAEWASCLSNLFNAWANHQQTDPSSTSAVNKLVGLTVQWMHALSQQLAVPSSSSSSATIALANIVLASLTAICSSEAGVTALRERGPQVTDPATSIVQLISMREEQPLQQLKSTLDQVIASPPGSN